jgi:hypothetical protein
LVSQCRAASAANAGTSAIFFLLQMLPEDAWWPVRLGAPDGLVRGDDEVHPEVMDGFGEGPSTTWSGWTVVARIVSGRMRLKKDTGLAEVTR